MIYYKLLDENGNFIDVADSLDLRYYENGIICACMEPKAQYVYNNNQYYRVCWLNPEDLKIKGKYPLIGMAPISKEEYLIFKEQQEKEKLEQK